MPHYGVDRMGAAIDVYYLMRLRGTDGPCEHPLLLKVERPGFSNVCEAEYQAAVEEGKARRDRLIAAYLAHECANEYQAVLEGELQGFAVQRGKQVRRPVRVIPRRE